MLTNPQLQTLKAAVLLDAAAAAALQAGDTITLASWLNGNATPAVQAWKTGATGHELDEGADYSSFDSIVAGKRDAWRLFLDYALRDMTRTKSRKTVTDVWGAAVSASIAEAILQSALRPITNAEKALGGSNAVSTGTVAGLKLTWEGPVAFDDVARLVNLP